MSAAKKELHYRDEPVKGWAESLSPAEPRKDTLVLKGKCPRCNHEVILTFVDETTTIGLNEYVGRVLGGERPVPLPRKVTAICHCGTPHPGTPDGKNGCGAYGGLALG